MKKVILSTLGVVFCFASFSVSAQNYYFMKGAAINYFTEEDATIYERAQTNALNNHKDGDKVSWSNPKSGAHGYFIPSDTKKEKDMTCRKLAIFNYAQHHSGLSSFKFCKVKNAWKIVS